MTTRKEILDQLILDIENKLKISEGYQFEPTVVTMGITNFEDAESRPVISFFPFLDEVTDEFLGTETRERILNILLYAYDDVNNNNYDRFFAFMQDVEKFINSTDWTYYDKTILGNINMVPSPDNSRVMFDMVIQVYYYQDL